MHFHKANVEKEYNRMMIEYRLANLDDLNEIIALAHDSIVTMEKK